MARTPRQPAVGRVRPTAPPADQPRWRRSIPGAVPSQIDATPGPLWLFRQNPRHRSRHEPSSGSAMLRKQRESARSVYHMAQNRSPNRPVADPETAGGRPRSGRPRNGRPRIKAENLQAQNLQAQKSAGPEICKLRICKPRTCKPRNLQAQNLQANLVGSSAGVPRRRPTARPCLTPAIGRYFRASRRPCALATPRLSALR